MSRARLPMSGYDVDKQTFGYSTETNVPPHNEYEETPQPSTKKPGFGSFVKWGLTKTGVFKKSWTTNEIEVTDQWNDWFYRNRKYILFSAFASFITFLIMTVLYINLFGAGKLVSSFNLKYKVKVLDLDNQKFRGWLKTVNWIEINDMSDLRSGVITAPLFLNSGPTNVTIGDLKELLEINCPRDEKECLCLSVFHLGFAANFIILNDFEKNTSSFLIEPTVTSQSPQSVKIRVGESKDLIETPAMISVEYFLESGYKTRLQCKNEHAACILECLKKY